MVKKANKNYQKLKAKKFILVAWLPEKGDDGIEVGEEVLPFLDVAYGTSEDGERTPIPFQFIGYMFAPMLVCLAS
jgi:hypothetical protein